MQRECVGLGISAELDVDVTETDVTGVFIKDESLGVISCWGSEVSSDFVLVEVLLGGSVLRMVDFTELEVEDETVQDSLVTEETESSALGKVEVVLVVKLAGSILELSFEQTDNVAEPRADVLMPLEELAAKS